MKPSETTGALSDAIRLYKQQLESVLFRGVVQEDETRQSVRIMLDGAGGPPVTAEIDRSDVVDIAMDGDGQTGTVRVKRGADYILSVVAVAGLEDDLPGAVSDVIASLPAGGGLM